MRRFPIGCRFFAAGGTTVLVLLLVSWLLIAGISPQGSQQISRALRTIGTFLLGVLVTMSFVGTLLLFKLTWRVDTPGRPGAQQRQPMIVIHGGGQPEIQQGRPALPPPEWPRQTRDWHMLGEEDANVTDGQYRHLPPNN